MGYCLTVRDEYLMKSRTLEVERKGVWCGWRRIVESDFDLQPALAFAKWIVHFRLVASKRVKFFIWRQLSNLARCDAKCEPNTLSPIAFIWCVGQRGVEAKDCRLEKIEARVIGTFFSELMVLRL